MKTYQIATALLLMSSTSAFAFNDNNNNQLNTQINNQAVNQTNTNVNRNVLGQGQTQGQGQGQRQLQGQAQNSDNYQSTEFNDRRQLPSVGLAAPSFGSSVGDGYLNACAGSEAWSVSLGASFYIPNGGAPIAGGIGGGNQELVTINLCEVREAAHMVAMRMEGETAEALHHAIMCQHPSYRAAIVSINRTCPNIQPYSMEIAHGSDETTTTTTQVVTTKTKTTANCDFGVNEWGRCVNPDLDG